MQYLHIASVTHLVIELNALLLQTSLLLGLCYILHATRICLKQKRLYCFIAQRDTMQESRKSTVHDTLLRSLEAPDCNMNKQGKHDQLLLANCCKGYVAHSPSDFVQPYQDDLGLYNTQQPCGDTAKHLHETLCETFAFSY